MWSEPDGQRLRDIERGIEADDPAFAAELRTAWPRRRIWPFLLLATAGAVVTIAGALTVNFDVFVLGVGCAVVGAVGVHRRRRGAQERTSWSG